MSVNYIDKSTGDLIRVAGGGNDVLYADAPIGAIIPFGGTTAPDGFLLCQGQAVSRTTYAELFGVIGTAYGTGDGSTTFNLPDLREATTKGVGLSGKSSDHYDSNGVTLGEFVEDRVKTHQHTITSIFVPGSETTTYIAPVGQSSGDMIVTANAGANTNEVKAVGVNYIIKATQVGAPADFIDAIDDALSTFAKPISLQPLNNSTINYDASRVIGGVVTVCADIIVQSGSTLVKENAVANIPDYSVSAVGYILPCLYRNTGSGAEEPGYAMINAYGNLFPYYTKTEYNEIRINASYASKV